MLSSKKIKNITKAKKKTTKKCQTTNTPMHCQAQQQQLNI